MNPYGITQFDAGSAIAAYDNESARRVAEMKRKAEIRKLDREDKQQAVWAKFGGYQDTPANAPPSSAAPQSPQVNPLFDPARRDMLLREMTTLDPEKAMQLAEGFSKLDKGKVDQVKETYKALGATAFQIRQLPPQQRAQALQILAPQLEQMGLSRDQIANLDLSDRALELQVGQIRDIEKLIDSTTRTVVPVSGVGLLPVTPSSPYPQFGGSPQPSQVPAPTASVLEYAKGELNAGRIMTFEQAQSFGMEKAASLGVPIVRDLGGKLYFMVNGQWYDNPEGR